MRILIPLIALTEFVTTPLIVLFAYFFGVEYHPTIQRLWNRWWSTVRLYKGE